MSTDTAIELWGGHECTVNRVGDRFVDQTKLTGHCERIDDLDRFAALGITALRYPVLWERISPSDPATRDWRWTDERLNRIRALGMRPIVGLIHHGSGPRYTSLVAENFVRLFAGHAAATAERYPWIDDWTPVNEPLTTARFATLYGHWYPHARDDRAFWTAMFNQVEATRDAMRAIRRVNPKARLVQTEDMGQTWSTLALKEVAEFYNDRRWLTFDMLAGRLSGPAHPLWHKLAALGFADRARALADDPCPADIIGINHYATSDRFLDHRAWRYRDADPRAPFQDLSAVRVLDPAPPGVGHMLELAWSRYATPLAITESHLGCTRDEQMRWLWESWRTSLTLRDRGVDVRAITAWALLGNVGWNSLLTAGVGEYEPGIIDLRRGRAAETGATRMLRAIGGDGRAQAWIEAHPVMAGSGWWRRDIRLEHPPHRWKEVDVTTRTTPAQPILITGATGTLGRAFAGACDLRGLAHVLTDRRTLPIEDADAVGAVLDRLRPWAVINTAGYVRVDDAEDDADACMRANADGPAVLAAACAARGIHFTTFSSDLVFDGAKGDPYVEHDLPAPLGVYGRSKADAEGRVGSAAPDALVVRTSAFFSPYDEHNFAWAVERSLRAGRPVAMSDAHIVTATYVPDLVRVVLDLVIDGEHGLWHLSSPGPATWYELARAVAVALDLDPGLIRRADAAELGWRAARPANVPLTSERGVLLPPFADALRRHVAVRRDAKQPRVAA